MKVSIILLLCVTAYAAVPRFKPYTVARPAPLYQGTHRKSMLNLEHLEVRSVIQYLEQIWRGVKAVIEGSIPHPFKCIDCYPDLGCFDACNGTLGHVKLLPETPERIGTKFRLFPWYDNGTELSVNYTDVSGLNSSIFGDPERGLLVINHGFSADSNSEWMVELKDMAIDARQQNVILVDWMNGAGPYEFFYPLAVANTDMVGRQIAVLLHQLMSQYSVKPSAINYVGHSLGAQIGHFMSKYLKTITDGVLINRITALDAASPLFEAYDVGLQHDDAHFVDALHTSAGDSILTGKLGVVKPVGNTDFYLNGGTNQPGCWRIDLICAHKRAHDYYVEAVRNQFYKESCIFKSKSCTNGFQGYLSGTCFSQVGNFSRISFDDSQAMPGNGVQYLETNSTQPFCIS